jgi:hypothetical protein
MSDTCDEPNPNDEMILCQKAPHPFGGHYNMTRMVYWDGLPMPVRTKQGGSRVKGVIESIEAAGAGKKTGPPSSFVRTNDPGTSHEAIVRYEPKRETAKGKVLAYLRERMLMWVDAPALTAPEVGGFAGTRRLRELRDDGYPIETRLKPGTTNTWQHRLLSD